MSRESIIFTVGLLVVIVPYLGVPEDWKRYFFIVAGALLMIVGYSLRRSAYLRSIEHDAGEHHSDSFVEHIHHS